MSFNGFISYSHAADGRLAPAVQRGLHRLAKPWHRRRALWIFRDQTGLSVTPALWTSIQKALDNSEYFVLMASPEAAQSPWVNREIEHWVATKPLDHILPVVSDGEWEWDQAAGDFSADSTSVPPALRGVFAEEPLYLDLRWARDDRHLSLRHSRFRDAIAQLAAPMHGVSKDDLEGEDVRQHRRAGRLRWSAVASLLVLTVLATVTGLSAVQNAAAANASAEEALRQQREAVAQRGHAARYADEAQKQEGLARDKEARAREAAAEAQKQELAAATQKELADKASGEVKVQLAKADKAAAQAKAQQRLAQRQAVLARESAQEARRQQARAKEQEQIAHEQQQIAGEAGAEATRQKQIAADQQKLAAAAAEQARKQEQIALEQEKKAKEAGDEAVRQQKVAISRRLVNEARAVVNDDSRTAFKLGVAAQTVNPADEVKRDVSGLITSTRHLGTMDDVARAVTGPRGLLITAAPETGLVTLWNASTPARPVALATIDDARNYTRMALSPDTKTLAIVWSQGVVLYDVSNPAQPARLSRLETPNRNNTAVAFSPDGRTLAVGDRTAPVQQGGDWGYATLYDIADRTQPAQVSVLRGHSDGQDPTTTIGFSPDGNTLVVAYFSAALWDVSDRAQPVLRGDLPLNSLTYGVTFHPNQPLLAIGDYNGTVNVFDVSDLTSPAVHMTFSSGTRGNLALAYSQDGRRLAAGFMDGTTVVWDTTEGDRREYARLQGRVQVNAIAFSFDQKTLITIEQAETAVLWGLEDFAGPDQRATVVNHDGITTVRYSRDGRTLVTAGYEGTAMFWKPDGHAAPEGGPRVLLHGGRPTSWASFSADLRTVVAGDNDHLTMVDTSDPAKAATFASMRTPIDASEVQLSPDGRYLLMAGLKRFVVWDIGDHGNPHQIADVEVETQYQPVAAFSPDGKTLAISAGKKVNIFSLAKPAAPRLIGTASQHAARVTAVTFGPGGRTLATGSEDRTAILWNIADPARPERLSTMTGHMETIGSIVFSDDAATMLVADKDRWSTVWDVAQPARPVRLARIDSNHAYDRGGMAFSPDNQTLALGVGQPNGPIGMWDLAPMNRLRADPAAFGCSITGTGLTQAEWDRFVPEMDYRKTCGG